jgi:hypothetical protein
MLSRYHGGATTSKAFPGPSVGMVRRPVGWAELPSPRGRGYSSGMAATDDEGGPRSRPEEPYVFECRSCGKVFEVRTERAFCPECDSGEVTRLTD